MTMKKKRTFKLTGKVALFLMTILMFTITIGCILGSYLMYEDGIYSVKKQTYLEKRYDTYLNRDASHIIDIIIHKQALIIQPEQKELLEEWCEKKNYAEVTIWRYYSDGRTEDEAIQESQKIWEWKNEKVDRGYFQSEMIYTACDNPKYSTAGILIDITLAKEPLAIQDNYQSIYRLASFLYIMRYGVFVIAFITLLLSIFGFIQLMCSSGRHKNKDGVHAGWGTAVPFDLLTIAAALALFLLSKCTIQLFNDATSPIIFTILVPLVMLSETIFLGWSMSLALRIKLRQWWKNTLIFHACVLVLKLIKTAIKGINYVPFIPKTIILIATVAFIELFFIFITLNSGNPDTVLYLWILEKIILIPLILYVAITLYKLKQGGNALVRGDLNYKIDTKYMIWDIKEHGETLNNIANGMVLALEERMKSERLKTELITNVSHDIKTPLTSIINYADLLNKEVSGESCEISSAHSNYQETELVNITAQKMNKIQEYSSILHRHSERLKRLIEDLIEASKAATGTIEVNLEPCDTAILLTQAIGEFEDKLQSTGLSIITNQPEQPVFILADGRRLWRIFDNLLNNICKYAQAGTRVYLTLEKQDNFAVITFKNTSRDALNISPDELMERFVRGDVSRHTEGNGLGLSIAKSLTELQNGTMDLTIDGDLFKVILKFPIHKAENQI